MYINLRDILYETKERLLKARCSVERVDSFTEYSGGLGEVLLVALDQLGLRRYPRY